jgi:hypothetical protein
MHGLAGMNPSFTAGPLEDGVEILLCTFANCRRSASQWKAVEKLPNRM